MPKIQLKQFNHNIFLVSFDNSYDLAMHFLRHSEFRESPVFRGQAFKIIDFIDEYSKRNNGSFTYPHDWAGFNLPSEVFKDLPFSKIVDFNRYDEFMQSLVVLIETISKSRFYLIGHVTGRPDAINHELAHAMFYMIPEFKQEMEELIIGLKDSYTIIEESLVKMDYHPDVCHDECQAYLSTGISSKTSKALRKNHISAKIATPFKKVFKKYRKTL